MKLQSTKRAFIELRAGGASYDKIASKLKISKSTCVSWANEFSEAIADLKSEQLDELYSTYYMHKEARIKKLGESLKRINKALDDIDFKTIAPEKLLDFKLKHMQLLREEYTGATKAFTFNKGLDAEDIIKALGELLTRVRSGDITPEQASRESAIITSLLKAYDSAILKAKLDALDSILER